MVPKHKALAAPELLDPEVMSALRRAVLDITVHHIRMS